MGSATLWSGGVVRVPEVGEIDGIFKSGFLYSCFLFPFTYIQTLSSRKKDNDFKTVEPCFYYSGFIFVVMLFSLFV